MEKLTQLVWIARTSKWRVQIGENKAEYTDFEEALAHLRRYVATYLHVGTSTYVPTYESPVQGTQNGRPDGKWAGEESRALAANLARRRGL